MGVILMVVFFVLYFIILGFFVGNVVWVLLMWFFIFIYDLVCLGLIGVCIYIFVIWGMFLLGFVMIVRFLLKVDLKVVLVILILVV